MNKLLLLKACIISVFSFAQAPSGGLVSYFNFENTLNSSSPAHSFTNATASNVTFGTGKYGQGAVFGGASTLINSTLTDAETLGINSTIAWWEFRPAGTPNNYSTSFEMSESYYYRAQNVSSCNGNYNNRYELGIYPSSWVCQTLQPQSALAGSWHHHAIVKQGGVINYYLDGAISISGWLLNSTAINGVTNKFTFGGGTNNGVTNAAKSMNGTLDELYIYNRALTATEVATVKNSANGTTTEPFNPTGLLAFYNFENNNNSFDNVHNLTNGTASNATYSTGKYGQSSTFTGTQALVNVTLASALNNGEYSVAFWEKRTTPPNIYSTSYEFFGSHYFRAAGNLSCGFKTTTNTTWGNVTMGATSDYLNTWTHYAFVWSTDTDGFKRMKCYINGQLTVSSLGFSGTSAIEHFNTIFSVGGGTSTDGNLHPSKYYAGNLDEFYIYNRAITNSEVMSIMANSAGVSNTTLSNQDVDSQKSNVTIYPNPATEVINIESKTPLQKIEIINTEGKILIHSFAKVINVSKLNQGVYFVKVTDEKGNQTVKKMIKK